MQYVVYGENYNDGKFDETVVYSKVFDSLSSIYTELLDENEEFLLKDKNAVIKDLQNELKSLAAYYERLVDDGMTVRTTKLYIKCV